jgi:hypothetical protein
MPEHNDEPDERVMSNSVAEPPRSDPYRWHANEADKLLRIASELSMPPNPNQALALEYVAVAQVHATLALAGARHTASGRVALASADDDTLLAAVGEAIRRHELPALREAAEILEDLLERSDCRLDHHGYCQEHGWFADAPRCPHARAREFLGHTDAASEAGREGRG